MQAIFSTLPKLNRSWHHAITTPKIWQRHFAFAKFSPHYIKLRKQNLPSFQNINPCVLLIFFKQFNDTMLLKRIIEPLVDSLNLSNLPSLFNTQVSSKNICSSDGWLDVKEFSP
jgi:hypothetical protein